MPTIVDALVVQLGLDSTDFQKGQREINSAWQKTRVNSVKSARDLEESNARLLGSFNKLKVEALGFLGALLGTREIKDFIANVTAADAAIGRLGTNLGESPAMLSAWGTAVEKFGGKSEEAATSLTTLSKAFYDLKYNGKALPPEVYRIFAAAHRSVDTSHGLDKFLNDTAGALKEISKTDRTAAFFFGQGMGLTPAMVSLMIQYGDATSKFVSSMAGLGPTDEQVKNAERLQAAWVDISKSAVAIGRDIENWFSPVFLKTLEAVQAVFDAIHGVTSQNPKDVADQIGMNEAAPGMAIADGKAGVKANGSDVTKSNPLPVQVVPNTAATTGGSSWSDWWHNLFGGGGGAGASSGGAGGGSPTGAAPHPAAAGGGRAGLAKRLGMSGGGGTGSWWTPERMKYAADRLQKEAGLSPMGAAGLVARWSGIVNRPGFAGGSNS